MNSFYLGIVLIVSISLVQCFQSLLDLNTNSKLVLKYRRSKTNIFSEFERSEPVNPISTNKNEVVSTKSDETEKEAPEISNLMKDKLKRELQSQGADPNYSAGPILGNPILIIAGVIAILVLAGGKDIFF